MRRHAYECFIHHTTQKYYLDARIASHVVTAVRQLWLPDVASVDLSHADRYDLHTPCTHLHTSHSARSILIPLIVFRNHRAWNSFEDAHIDVGLLKRELAKLKSPNQGILALSHPTAVSRLPYRTALCDGRAPHARAPARGAGAGQGGAPRLGA